MNLDIFVNKKAGIWWITIQNLCYLFAGTVLFVCANILPGIILGFFAMMSSIVDLINNWLKYKRCQ